MKKLMMTAALVLAAGAAQAQLVTGNDLLRYLKDDDLSLSAMTFINGTLKGASAALGDARAPRLFCLPDELNAGQVHDTVRKWLVRLPEERHRRAEILVLAIVSETWPCSTAPRQQPQRGGTSL